MTTSIENVEVKQSSEGNQVEVTTTMTPNHKNLKKNEKDFRPKISVLGVGGAGCNAVNNMIRSQLEGVEFIVMNTDAQALQQSLAERRVHLGDELTQGLGAGSSPDVGHAAAEESHEQIAKEIRGSNMVFIAAGMGGGTGTGSAPVIARTARDLGILTVGVVTKPFNFEGAHRMRTAERGIEELQKAVDTLIVIPNQNLFRVANENTTFADAFKMADDVLYAGVRSITDLMIMPGLINLDFADVRTVMSEMGKAMMGTGEADGEGRAIAAAAAAIANPLLDDVSMRGAKGVLISITGGMDMTLFEVDEAANRIREEVEVDANIIFGSTFDDRLNGRVRVSVVATGMQSGIQQKSAPPRPQEQISAQQSSQQPEGLFSPPASTLAQNNQNKMPEKPAERPILNLGSDELENREEDLMRDITLTSQASSSEDFLDATNERAPHSMPNIFEKMDEADDPLPPFSEQTETVRENNQMEIQFAPPSVNKKPSQPDRPQPPKESVSAGNFLSRFLRGRNKNPVPVTPPKEVPIFKTSQSLNPHKDSPNTFEDELDVPTFMRKQGSER